jgi:hypothetical protein
LSLEDGIQPVQPLGYKRRVGGFFLSYEAKLTRSAYLPMKVMLGLISMQVELGVAKSEQLESLVGDLP